MSLPLMIMKMIVKSLSRKAGCDREQFRGENYSYADDTRCAHRKLKSLMSDEQRPLVGDARNDESRYFEMCAYVHTALSRPLKDRKVLYWNFNRNLFLFS